MLRFNFDKAMSVFFFIPLFLIYFRKQSLTLAVLIKVFLLKALLKIYLTFITKVVART